MSDDDFIFTRYLTFSRRELMSLEVRSNTDDAQLEAELTLATSTGCTYIRRFKYIDADAISFIQDLHLSGFFTDDQLQRVLKHAFNYSQDSKQLNDSAIEAYKVSLKRWHKETALAAAKTRKMNALCSAAGAGFGAPIF